VIIKYSISKTINITINDEEININNITGIKFIKNFNANQKIYILKLQINFMIYKICLIK